MRLNRPCDVFLGAHGAYFNLLQKLPRASAKGPSVWIDPQGYQAAINDAESNFNADLARQEAARSRPSANPL